SANSWMQTPQGFEIGADGLYYPTSWMDIIFNPSFIYRLTHMSIAAFLSTAFVVAGVAGYYLLKKVHTEHAKIMLFMAMLMAAFVAPLQLIVGDLHGLNTFKHQGAKLAAMEGIWENEKGAGLRLFAIPDAHNETNHYELIIPELASLILTHSWDGEIKGLKAWPKAERPPVGIVFWSFRVMVGIGFLMIGTGIMAVYLYARKRLYTARWFHYWCMMMAPSGFIALLAGWFVTEIGRQPYTVYGVLKTADSVSPAIIAEQIMLSLGAFIVVYVLMLLAALYYIFKMIHKGPQSFDAKDQYYANSMEAAFTHSLLQGNPNHD
ncbi:MAG: cytochrome ubiquinol oxidase subunit I, partial [Alphaproteobacteria bacterium]|nr:cytochrome ubiquinol oxidase subunit I [Alphaproteobacteria bacterium]